MSKHLPFFRMVFLILFFSFKLGAQQMMPLPLNDLSAFKPQAGNWKVAGSVTSPFTKDKEHHKLDYTAGAGILVNDNDAQHNSALISNLEHQDLDIEFEFMMPAGSNSGIYLQGRYEVQLFDSWGKAVPDITDLGGIYRNWESDPKTAYAGKAPMTNAARPPGIWQKMFISFSGPRFDANGKKIKNARFNKVLINNQLVHLNVEVPQPTGGPIENNEVSRGPLMIQGDHGSVAFKNISYRTFEDAKVEATNVSYKYWKGPYEYDDDFKNKKADLTGKSPEGITWDVSPVKDFFALQLTGDLQIPIDDNYYISTIYNGNLAIYIDDQLVKKISRAWDWDRPAKSTIMLKAGKHKIDVYFCRADAWLPPAIGIFFESDKLALHGIHARSSLQPRETTYPILVKLDSKPKVLRAFLDFNGQRSQRLTHTVGVGDPSGIHYVYNNSNGSLACVWRGEFVDATPMWHDRGDGSFKPLGDVVFLTNEPQLDVVTDPSSPHPKTYEEGRFRSRGYTIDKSSGAPVFHYELDGMKVQDMCFPDAMENTLIREIKIENTVPGTRCRIAYGNEIQKLESGRYLINGRYMIELADPSGATLRKSEGFAELFINAGSLPIRYKTIW
ncbi:MAG: family 16 glycoside hydrolase [Saprospiraceae bacterium]|nr:DUF1080 domain-containing protein [Saprospiraceae bacterium]